MSLAVAIAAQEAGPVQRLRRPRARTLATAIVIAGLLLRLLTLAAPHVFFPDEIFQYLEAAHRLAFGPGVVPWEYREHVRNWLVPLMLAGPMRLGAWIAPDSGLYLLLPRLLLLAISMATIPAAAAIGRRFSALHALFAMLVAAASAEFVYFSTITLTEPFAAFLFLFAAALLYRHAEPSKRQLMAAGALLALTCLVRFQYGPAAVVLVVAMCVRAPQRILWIMAGGLPLLALSSAIDLGMGDRPFGWLFANIHQNITLGRSHAWVDGPLYYIQSSALVWGIWLAPILLFAALGARRCPGLMFAAITNLLVHNLIAHKEYRYILLTTMVVAILASIGTAEAIRWLRRRSSPGRWRNLRWILAGGWLAASASIAVAGPMHYWWDQQRNQLAAFASLRATPDICGVAIFGLDWSMTGGYAYLHRPVPLLAFAVTERAQLSRDASQFNAIVAPEEVATPTEFDRERCFSSPGQTTICVRSRRGECATAVSPAEINRKLIRLDR